MTAEFVSKSPERFIGFAYVSPTMPDRMLPELERAIDCLGLRAIKLYPQYNPISPKPLGLESRVYICK